MSQPDLDKLTSELEELAEEEARHTELIGSDLPISREGIKQAEVEAKKIKKRVEAKHAEIERVSSEIRGELQQQRLREQVAVAERAVSKAMEPIENGLTGDMVWIKHADGGSSGKWDKSVIPECPETLIGIRIDLTESIEEPEEDAEPDSDGEEPEDEPEETDDDERFGHR